MSAMKAHSDRRDTPEGEFAVLPRAQQWWDAMYKTQKLWWRSGAVCSNWQQADDALRRDSASLATLLNAQFTLAESLWQFCLASASGIWENRK
jgi:hypothetical protein